MTANPNNPMDLLRPTDPRLDAMLDQALAPESAPLGLVGRILAQTAPLLARPRGVLARLGIIHWHQGLAAGIILAASLALVLTIADIASDTHQLLTLKRGLYSLTGLDQNADRIEQVIVDGRQDLGEPLDTRAIRRDLDAVELAATEVVDDLNQGDPDPAEDDAGTF